MKYEAEGIRGYYRDPWNCLDFTLCVLAVLDNWVLAFLASGANLKILGILRILRLLKLVRMVKVLHAFKELQLIVAGLLECAKTIVWVALLLLIVLWTFAILTTMLIGQAQEEDVYGF